VVLEKADSKLNVRTTKTEAVTSRIIALLSSRRRSMFYAGKVVHAKPPKAR
jgi:hypothetical protein